MEMVLIGIDMDIKNNKTTLTHGTRFSVMLTDGELYYLETGNEIVLNGRLISEEELGKMIPR